jgi:hypothetical protein
MGDLYNSVRAYIRPVDVVAFWGPPRNPVSGLIELVTDGPSHVAPVRQPLIVSKCAPGCAHPCEPVDVKITESTIKNHRSGVQTNPLGQTLAGYPGGSRAEWYPLSAVARARVDLRAFYECCGANDGITGYDWRALFRFLLPDWITQRFTPARLRAEVCSVWVATALEAARVTCGVPAARMKPSDIIALPVFGKPVRIL